MKRQLFKWSAVLVLLAVSVVCVYFYTVFDTPITPENPDVKPSTPTIGAPSEEERVPKTEFPKAPLLSPFSGCNFLSPLSGSGDDVVREILCYDDFIYAIGDTNSPDYDFVTANASIFIAKLSLSGTILCVTTKEGVYSSAKVTPFGIAVVSTCGTGTVLTVFDYDLVETQEVTVFGATGGVTALGGSHLYLVTKSVSEVISYTPTGEQSRVSIPNLVDILSVEYIMDTLYVVGNTTSSPLIISLKDDNIISSPIETLDKVQSVVPFFDKKVGFVTSGLKGDKCTLSATFFDGETSWVKTFLTADLSSVVPISDGYLLFIEDDTASTCIRLCSHGDIMENCILSFTNLMPCQYVVTSLDTFILLRTKGEEKSTVATFSVTDGARLKYQFNCTTPRAFVLGEGIIVALTNNTRSGNFASGIGGEDTFILGLI